MGSLSPVRTLTRPPGGAIARPAARARGARPPAQRCGGHDGVLMVHGEPGVGKTALLDATIRQEEAELLLDASTLADHRQLGTTWNPLRMIRGLTKLVVQARLTRESPARSSTPPESPSGVPTNRAYAGSPPPATPRIIRLRGQRSATASPRSTPRAACRSQPAAHPAATSREDARTQRSPPQPEPTTRSRGRSIPRQS
jgi:hypothetical protein